MEQKQSIRESSMRITDDRYFHQRAQLDLALRMIRLQARTGTIRHCTGLSDDRIRKLYTTYFKGLSRPVHRLRGKTPQQPYYFVRNATNQSEATTLALLFTTYGVLRRHPDGGYSRALLSDTVVFGNQVCDAFEAYIRIHPRHHLSFERAWCLVGALVCGEELNIAVCQACNGTFVNDALALSDGRCPCCKLKALA
jgi:hypothetical protein